VTGWPFKIRQYDAELNGTDYAVLQVDIVPTHVERIVPPAGEEHAFDVQRYRRRVEVSVSPTGRSVRVWVDGVEVRA
jgi:hypothetical protein